MDELDEFNSIPRKDVKVKILWETDVPISKQQVIIYHEDQWHNDVVIDLGEQVEKFEELKPLIVFAAANLCKIGCIMQKFDRDDKFAYSYDIAYIRIEIPYKIRLTYYGTTVNTEFDVVMQIINDDLILKSFGMIKDIQPDWEGER